MRATAACLPILALIFTREIAADDHRLGFRVIYVGRKWMARPRATSAANESGVICAGMPATETRFFHRVE